jgi:hypothetical protein
MKHINLSTSTAQFHSFDTGAMQTLETFGTRKPARLTRWPQAKTVEGCLSKFQSRTRL